MRATSALFHAALLMGCAAANPDDRESPFDDAGDTRERDGSTADRAIEATAGERADSSAGDAWQLGDDGGTIDAASAPDAPLDCGGDAGGPPFRLACTGLYSDWASRTIASAIRSYAPAFPLWSDGAEKARFIQLPAGTQIDTGDMDQWRFPAGTKLWKEFRIGGQPVETRFLWKRADGSWVRTTYEWALDGRDATELTSGHRNWNGTSYEIPSQDTCLDCHGGRLDTVLGFEAVSLAAPGATGLTLAELVREGLVTQPPAAPIIVPGDAVESAALGWLHGNCGTSCHNRTSWGCVSTLFMRLEVASMSTVQATDTWNTAVGKPLELLNDYFVPPWPMLRITRGDPARSAVSYRASVRDADPMQPNQMPPTDTHAVPDRGIAAINAWITAMSSAP